MEEQRIIELGKLVWANLTQKEIENYAFSSGTIGFIEHIMLILHINNEFTEEVFERIHNAVIIWED